MANWLVSESVANEMRSAIASGRAPTVAQSLEYTAAQEKLERESIECRSLPRNMVVAGSTASIRIEGLLTPKPDLFAAWFGGGNTTYGQIADGLAIAETESSIKNVEFLVSSPGGQVDGLFELLAQIEAFSKPIAVKASKANSAAYAIATVAGKITASTIASDFGSVGVAASYWIDPETVDIASTEAPRKRPDLATDEGKAVVREELDAIHDIFVTAIATGRTRHTGTQVTAKDVNETFGRGGVLLANEAKKRGMIDKVPSAANGSAGRKRADSLDNEEVNPMDKVLTLSDLQAQRPDLYSAAVAVGRAEAQADADARVTAAVAAERERVEAHLELGKSCDAMDIALTAIADGSPLNQKLTAKYLSAGQNKRQIDAREEQTGKASQVAGAAGAAPEEVPDMGDYVVAQLKAARGLK